MDGFTAFLKMTSDPSEAPLQTTRHCDAVKSAFNSGIHDPQFVPALSF